MRKHYAAVRVTEHVSGRHVWVIGRYETLTAARHARNDAIEGAADHLAHHGGKGQVLITPTDFLGIGYAVTLVAPDGVVEADYLFRVEYS
jgi:rRNA processing protein Krr1/Pno1